MEGDILPVHKSLNIPSSFLPKNGTNLPFEFVSHWSIQATYLVFLRFYACHLDHMFLAPKEFLFSVGK